MNQIKHKLTYLISEAIQAKRIVSKSKMKFSIEAIFQTPYAVWMTQKIYAMMLHIYIIYIIMLYIFEK